MIEDPSSQPPPCEAATRISGADDDYPASYHWCVNPFHHGPEHECFCGTKWDEQMEGLAKLTPEMRQWRRRES